MLQQQPASDPAAAQGFAPDNQRSPPAAARTRQTSAAAPCLASNHTVSRIARTSCRHASHLPQPLWSRRSASRLPDDLGVPANDSTATPTPTVTAPDQLRGALLDEQPHSVTQDQLLERRRRPLGCVSLPGLEGDLGRYPPTPGGRLARRYRR